jgi:hypothetical protein
MVNYFLNDEQENRECRRCTYFWLVLAIESTVIKSTHMSCKPTLDKTKVLQNNILYKKYFELLCTELGFPVNADSLCVYYSK